MKKLSKGKKITIVVVALLIIGLCLGATGGTDDKYSVEWNTQEKYGEITFNLEGNEDSASSIKIEYFSECADYIQHFDVEEATDCEFFRFVAMIKDEDGNKIGRILGELPINFTDSSEYIYVTGQDIEDNMTYLLLPDFMEE